MPTYTGLAEMLGPERAEILMSQLPRFDPAEVATKADLAALRDGLEGEMGGLRTEMGELRGEMGELRSGMGELRSELLDLRKEFNSRLERMYTTLVAGLFVIVAAMAGVFFSTL